MKKLVFIIHRSRLVLVVLFISCFSRPLVADIGVVDTETPKTWVLYEDGDKVYLKICQPPVAPPLTRNCDSVETPQSVDLNQYLEKLPYEAGAYPRTDSGLRLLQKALDDAQTSGAPEKVVNRLKMVRENLETILKVRDDLKAVQQNLTYYEYQNEFAQLQIPFGVESPNGMNFVSVPAGTFLMGSPVDELGYLSSELLHRVKISSGFEIQRTEVTQIQWYLVMKNNPSTYKIKKSCPNEWKQIESVAMCPNHPVDYAAFHHIQIFINKLNEQEHQFVYRLPTEAEWEYAARAGSTGPYAVPEKLEEFAWYRENSGNRTHPVALLKPNNLGLYDIHGNISELVSDWYGDYTISYEIADPAGPTLGIFHVDRGGAFHSTAQSLRLAKRHVRETSNGHGFRLVRTHKK